jgi:hypothetical protein
VLWSISKPTQATAHTCTLRRAMNLIVPKITKASRPNMRNAYKNKYTSKWFKLSHTWSMVQTYAMNATYTPRTIMDLKLCIFKENQEYFKNKYF